MGETSLFTNIVGEGWKGKCVGCQKMNHAKSTEKMNKEWKEMQNHCGQLQVELITQNACNGTLEGKFENDSIGTGIGLVCEVGFVHHCQSGNCHISKNNFGIW